MSVEKFLGRRLLDEDRADDAIEAAQALREGEPLPGSTLPDKMEAEADRLDSDNHGSHGEMHSRAHRARDLRTAAARLRGGYTPDPNGHPCPECDPYERGTKASDDCPVCRGAGAVTKD